MLFLILFFGIYLYKPLYLIFWGAEQVPQKSEWLTPNALTLYHSVAVVFLIALIIRKDLHQSLYKLIANKISAISPKIPSDFLFTRKAEIITVSAVLALFFIFILLSKLALFTDITYADNQPVRAAQVSLAKYWELPPDDQLTKSGYLVRGILKYWFNNRFVVVFYGFIGNVALFLHLPYRVVWCIIDSLNATTAVAFAYLTAKLFCSKRVSLIVLGLSASFLAFSCIVTPLANTMGDWYTCYTDTVALPFVTLSIYFYAKFFVKFLKSGKKINRYILLGTLFSAIGYLFKPPAFITAIAFLIVYIVSFSVISLKKLAQGKKLGDAKYHLLEAIVTFVLTFFFITIVSNAIFKSLDIEKDENTPGVPHFILLGMLNTSQEIRRGDTFVFEDRKTLNPFQDRGRFNYAENGFDVDEVLKARIDYLGASLPMFYFLKDCSNLSFHYTKGSVVKAQIMSPESYYKTPFLQKWREFILKIQLPIRAVLWNIMYLLIAFWSLRVLKLKKPLAPLEMFISFSMMGSLAYLTIFESGDRYPLMFWALYFIVAGMGLNQLIINNE